MPTKSITGLMPILSCLLAATLWGILWYPLRVLEQMGLPGLWAALIIYISALLPALPYFWRQRRGLIQQPYTLMLIGIFAGWTNLAFILALLNGTVVRVLLLFYLSPVWAVLLGWLILKEYPSRISIYSILIALTGAGVMLWQPEMVDLFHGDVADLLAISSGLAFAFTNVCVRKAGEIPMILKMGPAWIGVITMSLFGIMIYKIPVPEFSWIAIPIAVSVGCLGMTIMTYTAQYGVTHLPLHRSSVIFLFEVVAGAVSAAILTNEILSIKEWTGGALVMLAAWLIAMDSMWSSVTGPSESNKAST